MFNKKFIFKNILLSFFLIFIFFTNTTVKAKNEYKLITFFDIKYSNKFFFNKKDFLNFNTNTDDEVIFFSENQSSFIKSNFVKSRIKLNIKKKDTCTQNIKFNDKIYISKGDDSKLFDLITLSEKQEQVLIDIISKSAINKKKKQLISDLYLEAKKKSRNSSSFKKLYSLNDFNDFHLKLQTTQLDLLKKHLLNIKNNLIGKNNLKFVNFYSIEKTKKDYFLTIKILLPNKLYNSDKIVIDFSNLNLKYFNKINLNFNDFMLKTIEGIKTPVIDFQELKIKRNKLKKLKHIYIFFKIPREIKEKDISLNINDYITNIQFYEKFDYIGVEKTLDKFFASLSRLEKIMINDSLEESAILSKIKKTEKNIQKQLRTYFQFTNNSDLYNYDVLAHNQKYKPIKKFFIYNKSQCLEVVSAYIDNYFYDYFIKKFDKREIRSRIKRSLNNYFDYININNIKYNYNELFLTGDIYQNKLVQKNFFVTHLSKEEFLKIKNSKISSFNIKINDFINYSGSVLVDNKNEEFQIKLLKNKVKDKINLIIFIVMIVTIIFYFIFFRKNKIYLKKNYFDNLYNLITSLLIFVLLINMFNPIVNQYITISLVMLLLILLSITTHEAKK